MKFHDILEVIKQYNFTEVFLWLQVAASHPSNQKYTGRFDLLNSLLLSICPIEFSNKQFFRTDFEKLLELLQQKYGQSFWIYIISVGFKICFEII